LQWRRCNKHAVRMRKPAIADGHVTIQRTIGVKPINSVALFLIPVRGQGRNERSVSAGGTPLPVWTRSIATALAAAIALGLLSGCAAHTKQLRADEPSTATPGGAGRLLHAIDGTHGLPWQHASTLCIVSVRLPKFAMIAVSTHASGSAKAVMS